MASNDRERVRPPRELLASWLGRLYRHRLTTTTGGNLSLLDEDGTFYITPSGGDKAIVPPSNIAILRPEDEEFEGPRPPSMEWPLHTAVYRVRPNCRAVVHAHSMTLVAFSLALRDSQTSSEAQSRPPSVPNRNGTASSQPSIACAGVPDTRCLLSAWQACGRVALAPYAIPGSEDLADGCASAFSTGVDCVILQNHGVVTAGATLQEAYDRFVSLEYLAQSIVHALPLGTPKPLPAFILRASRPSTHHRDDNASKRPRLLEGPCHVTSHLQHSIDKCPAAPCCCHQRTISGEEKSSREVLCKYVARAYHQNIVTSSSGSFSVRVCAEQRARDSSRTTASFLVTPTDVDRGSLESTDLCFISNADHCRHASGCRFSASDKSDVPQRSAGDSSLRFHPVNHHDDVKPSRASAIHAAIYEAHPEVNCIMIVQPPHATAYCITGENFNAAGIPESYLVLGDVQTISIDNALKDDFSGIVEAIDSEKGRHTIMISGYGLLTVASDPLKAFVQVEVCESMCGVMLTALRRGPVKLLSRDQIGSIRDAFKIGH